jgi:photosystem II stability/assembly factor-like uncharacterized protein
MMAHPRRTLLFTGAALLLCVSGATARDWVKQKSGTLAWLYGVYFLDAQTGWAVGSQGTLLHTTDGGATWKAQYSPTLDTIRAVHFFDRETGWLVCERHLAGAEGAGSYLYFTNDGGGEWIKIKLPGNGADRVTRMVFAGRGRGWLLGEAGALYETENGGESWYRHTVPTRQILLGGALLNDNTGWLASAGGTLLLTSDGGNTWQEGRFFNLTAKARLTAVSFADARRGWLVGKGGQIFTTTNGGRTWRAQTSGILEDLLDVKFVNNYDGWAVGDKGAMVSTKDGGFHWQSENTGTTHRLERLFFTDPAHGWAVGFGGTILAFGSATEQAEARLK